MLRRLVAVPTAVLALSLLTSCSGDDDEAAEDTSSASPSESESSAEPEGTACEYLETGDGVKDAELPPADATVTGELPATIATSVGDFAATLDADNAPCTVNSFVSLADQGYFDDTQCHRLVPEGIFVLQCGDPSATGTGGPGYSFADELQGTETYPAGTLAMANAGADTNGSQFFIVYADSPLDADYTVFGSVDQAGIDLAAEVGAAGNGPDGVAPATEVAISEVTVEQ